MVMDWWRAEMPTRRLMLNEKPRERYFEWNFADGLPNETNFRHSITNQGKSTITSEGLKIETGAMNSSNVYQLKNWNNKSLKCSVGYIEAKMKTV